MSGVPATTGPGRFQAGAAPNSNRCSRPCSLRKRKVLASRPAAPYNPQPRGAVAQLGERRVRIAKVVGSIPIRRSEEHTSELQSLMRISYAVFCLNKKQKDTK